jgi:hypothetical protein
MGKIPYTKSYKWNYYTCGINLTLDSHCNFSSSNFTFDSLLEYTEIYSAITTETKQEAFRINITYDSGFYSSVSAILIYNGTSYFGSQVGSGNNIEFNKIISIPILSTPATENKNFYWDFTFTANGNSYKFNSTSHSQSVNAIIFQNCNATFKIPIVVNFTIYDEDNRSLINVSTFEATFQYKVSGSISTKNFSYTAPMINSSFIFCTNTNDTYVVDSTIKINKIGYNERTYFLKGKSYTNITTNEKLYLLNSNFGSNIIIQVKNPGLQPLAG